MNTNLLVWTIIDIAGSDQVLVWLWPEVALARRELHDSPPSTWLYLHPHSITNANQAKMLIRIARLFRQLQQLLPTHRQCPRWQNTQGSDPAAGDQHPWPLIREPPSGGTRWSRWVHLWRLPTSLDQL